MKVVTCVAVLLALAMVPDRLSAEYPLPGKPLANEMETLLKTIRKEKGDAGPITGMVTKLANQYKESHALFLGLFTNSNVPRIKRAILSEMSKQKMADLAKALALALDDQERNLRADASQVSAVPALPAA